LFFKNFVNFGFVEPPDLAADSFVEKFAATVIKNLQVTIRNIHIRYEDKYSNRSRPFVVGATLEGINFKTTDENWNETIHKEVVKVVYKLVSLNNLALYWNSDSTLFSDLTDHAKILQEMNDSIVVGNKKPSGYKYMLEPINMQAKLALNQKPETDGSNWTIPKISLQLGLDILALAVGKYQYQDLLLLLEAQERFRTAAQYLKYRPNLNEYRGHYKEWWHFAYKAILEENVRRRRNNWNWERMKKHRKLVKSYKAAWLKKQTEKNLSSEDQNIIEEADMEIDRRGLKRVEDQPQGWIGWAKSWWSGDEGEQKKAEGGDKLSTPGDIVSKFEQAMTPEEKAKLFEAIDYQVAIMIFIISFKNFVIVTDYFNLQENTPPTDYPKHFVENVIVADLNVLMIVIEDAITLKFTTITTKIQQRPAAQAVNLKSGIKKVTMDGCGQPVLFMQDESTDWLTVLVDTNPLDRDKAGYDQYVKLAVAPTFMKYHAPAINTAIEALRPPESDVKARSLTGLAHAVDTKTKLMLDIRISPLTIVISEGGIFDEGKRNLIADLGLLTLTTVDDSSFAEASYTGNEDAERRQQLLIRAYDKFNVKLTNVQLIFADNYGNGMAARTDPKSPFHLLQPTGMDIGFHKSSIDDLQLPKYTISGFLKKNEVQFSRSALLQVFFFQFEKARVKDLAKMRAIMEVAEIEHTAEKVEVKKEESGVGGEPQQQQQQDQQQQRKTDVQQIQLELNLTLDQVGLVIGTPDAIFLSVQIRRLGCGLQMRTFDMVATAYLGDLTVEQPQYKSLVPGRETLFVIDNTHKSDQNLLQLKYVQANKESPFFATDYKSTEQAIDFSFRTLTVTLHQLQEQQGVKPKETAVAANAVDAAPEQVEKRALSRTPSQQSVKSLSTFESMKLSQARRQRELEQAQDDRIIKTHVNALFDALSVYVGSNECLDTSLGISEIRATVIMKVRTMEVEGGVKAITMEDCTGHTIHKHLLALCGEDMEMLSFTFKQFNRSDAEKKQMKPSDLDM
uniref:VPS13 domain-containing protein n=1 Tax=Gongylonema pulchrum TaxID=637853 RepID=A0A183DUY2_9BILA